MSANGDGGEEGCMFADMSVETRFIYNFSEFFLYTGFSQNISSY